MRLVSLVLVFVLVAAPAAAAGPDRHDVGISTSIGQAWQALLAFAVSMVGWTPSGGVQKIGIMPDPGGVQKIGIMPDPGGVQKIGIMPDPGGVKVPVQEIGIMPDPGGVEAD